MANAYHIVRKLFPDVQHIKDSDEKTTIEVTKKDNSSATVRNHKSCAMAVACKRKFNLDGVIISIHTAYLIKGKTATRYFVPESVSREIISFDRNGGFAEGEYTLNKVPKNHRLGDYHAPAKNEKHTSRKVIRRHFTQGIRTSLTHKEIA